MKFTLSKFSYLMHAGYSEPIHLPVDSKSVFMRFDNMKDSDFESLRVQVDGLLLIDCSFEFYREFAANKFPKLLLTEKTIELFEIPGMKRSFELQVLPKKNGVFSCYIARDAS